MIRFSCPECGKRFQVDEVLAGRRTQCKACGGSLFIPGKSTTTTAAAKPSPAAKKPASEVDDPYGLAEALVAESTEAEGSAYQSPDAAASSSAGRRFTCRLGERARQRSCRG